MAFGQTSRQHGPRVTYLTERAGGLLAAVTWIGFGALAISTVLPDITWQVVLYAFLSLTVVRMLPFAVAVVHSGAAGRRWSADTAKSFPSISVTCHEDGTGLLPRPRDHGHDARLAAQRAEILFPS
jgi:hypothetical protein